jgi:hypothetical protein
VAEYTVLIADQSLTPVGDPISVWTQIDITLRFNEPSSGLFKAPGYSWVREQIQPGNRVIIIRDEEVLISGPIEQWIWERSDDGDNAGAGQITVNFADYLSLIVSRLTYPDPALAPSAQTGDYWEYSDLAEHALRTLVLWNAGGSALTDRRIPNLVLGAFAGVGGSITEKAESMEPMGEVMRRVAVNGGNLGFRTRQVNSEILFEVYAPPDLSNQVVFGFGHGSLKYISYEGKAPTVNAAIVGGQGEGADRYLIEVGNLASQYTWDRREQLVNRPGNDPLGELQAAGAEALAAGVETARVASSAADTPFLKFGRDYTVGSKVSVESWPGSMISDVVVTVHLQVYPTAGEVITPTVGSQAAKSDPAWIQRMRALDRRIAYLERNVLPAVI